MNSSTLLQKAGKNEKSNFGPNKYSHNNCFNILIELKNEFEFRVHKNWRNIEFYVDMKLILSLNFKRQYCFSFILHLIIFMVFVVC